MDKIYLVGFMGAGKTSVARALAGRLGWRALDIDELIEQRERQTIADLFTRRGEHYFRTAERAALLDQVTIRNTVVATGGGTFVDPQNRAVIQGDGLTVWLDVPIEQLIARVPTDGRRPLAADRSQFERLYTARRVAYEEARIHIDASLAPINAVVDQIMDALEA